MFKPSTKVSSSKSGSETFGQTKIIPLKLKFKPCYNTNFVSSYGVRHTQYNSGLTRSTSASTVRVVDSGLTRSTSASTVRVVDTTSSREEVAYRELESAVTYSAAVSDADCKEAADTDSLGVVKMTHDCSMFVAFSSDGGAFADCEEAVGSGEEHVDETSFFDEINLVEIVDTSTDVVARYGAN